jgi:phosphoglycolate phosphatase
MAIILFDFDGVLADTLDDTLNFGRKACAQMGFERSPSPADLDALDTMSVMDYGRQLNLPAHRIEEFSSRYLQMFTRKPVPPKMFAGMDRVISGSAEQHKLAIVTGNTTVTVEAFLKHYALRQHIKFVIGVEQQVARAEKIRIALREIGRTEENAYMIGDSISDIRAARETSIKSIAVSWGHQSLSRLKAANPDYLVHSPKELAELLKNISIRE